MNPVADSHLQVAENYRDYALASESGPGNLNTRQGMMIPGNAHRYPGRVPA
jgi:hypothetical protein